MNKKENETIISFKIDKKVYKDFKTYCAGVGLKITEVVSKMMQETIENELKKVLKEKKKGV